MSESPDDINDKLDSLRLTRKRSRSGVDSSENPPSKVSRSSSLTNFGDNNDEMKTIISAKDKLLQLTQPPSFGKLGRVTSLKVNCFRVHCRTSEICQYSISFDPDLPDDSNVKKQAIINEKMEEFNLVFGGVFLFENMRIWALKKMPMDITTIEHPEHSIKIEYIKSVDLKHAPFEEFSQILHVLLSRATKESNLIKIGRCYYNKNNMNEKQFLLQRDRIRLFRGYSMNVDQTLDGLALTVDISHRVISIDSCAILIDKLEDDLSGRPRVEKSYSRGRGNFHGNNSRNDSYGTSSGNDDRVRNNSQELMKKVEEELIGRSVITTYRMRNWRIDQIDWSQNIDSKFEWRKKSGEVVNISYREYFLENYSLRLTNTRYGMVVNLPKRKGNSKNRKGPDRFVLPMETCYMTGLSLKMKSDNTLMKKIRDIVSLDPPGRYNGITEIVKHINHAMETSSSEENSDSSSDKSQPENFLKLDIEPKGIQIEGRVLDSISATIKTNQQNQKVLVKDLMRHWSRMHHINQNPHTVDRWVIMHEPRFQRTAHQLADSLLQASRNYRVIKQPTDIIEVNVNQRGRSVYNKWKDTLEDVLEKIKDLQLIVVVLPTHFKADDVYKAVKSATLLHGRILVPTQCVKAQRFDMKNTRTLRSVMNGVCKQILTKRGNVPWLVNFSIKGKFNPFKRNTMVCGVDINHDMKRNRSTAGFCVSSDSRFSRYDTFVSIGDSGKDIIEGAEDCMVSSLLNFYVYNKQLPQHIIVYRDGVSNSELLNVLNVEVKAIRKAFQNSKVLKKSKETYSPKLTFVVVQKRVSLRIFNRQLMSAEPGTILDNSIVSSRFWDFYMLTTSPPRGKTSRPTRYIVIYDDYGLENDELQSFTYQNCHTYYNFPGPIRVPAPVQIAHQVAYLYGTIISDVTKSKVFTPMCKGKAYYL